MSEIELQKVAYDGIGEAMAWYTVAIDTSLANCDENRDKRFPDGGTGTLVKTTKSNRERYFILTCKHVFQPNYDETKISFLLRSPDPMVSSSQSEMKNFPLNKISKTYMRKLTIKNRFYSNYLDDLALIEIDASRLIDEGYRFYSFPNDFQNLPNPQTEVYLLGFSRELYRLVSKDGGFGVFPYLANSLILPPADDLDSKFDVSKHFLIDYENEDAVAPEGLSGCGIWYRTPSGRDNIWTPNLHLIGVQSACYKKKKFLKATKIERIIALMDTLN